MVLHSCHGYSKVLLYGWIPIIGGDINTMSIYSMSLRLLVEGQFFHPGYQMDDIIYTLSAMRATGGRIRIRTIDTPT